MLTARFQAMADEDSEFSEDLLRGAEDIALFLFGSKDSRRKIYHLIARGLSR
jgi:hypothetical protein